MATLAANVLLCLCLVWLAMASLAQDQNGTTTTFSHATTDPPMTTVMFGETTTPGALAVNFTVAVRGMLSRKSGFCPAEDRRTRCESQRYRTVDGSCNNLRYPSLGRSGTPLLRLVEPEYGQSARNGPEAALAAPAAPRAAQSGRPLPSAQDVSARLFPQVDREYHTTHLFVIWGQLVSHDFAQRAAPKNSATGPCCQRNAVASTESARCMPISVSRNDPFYRQFNVTCLPFTRTNTTNCGGQSEPEQLSGVTHFLDASFLYGSDDATSRRLRQFEDGLLRARIVDDGSGHRNEYLPNVASPGDTCAGRTPCYDAGDARVNQNPMLAALQILFLREHNRVAHILQNMNPHWNDERLFQEARRVVVAEWQHIVYCQWLQWLLGPDRVRELGLRPEGASPHSEYRDDVDPRTANDVTTGSMRALHSMVQGRFWMGARGQRTEQLGRWFDNPGPVLERGQGLLDTLLGLAYQQSQDQDRWMDNEVTQQYEPIRTRDGRQWGNNLVAVDIQRGRDHWLPGYTKYREYVGLSEAEDFDDLLDSLNEEDVDALEEIYEHVDDVDYYVGGLLERRKRGAFLFGPTFQSLAEDQFWRFRFGDRFFYNFAGFAHSFNQDQLRALQRATAGRLLCDNVRGLRRVPQDPFIEIGFRGNGKVSCSSLPRLDLSCWKEFRDGDDYGCHPEYWH